MILLAVTRITGQSSQEVWSFSINWFRDIAIFRIGLCVMRSRTLHARSIVTASIGHVEWALFAVTHFYRMKFSG